MNNGQKQIGLASHFEWVFWHPIRFGTPKTVTYECDFQIIRIPSNFQRRENFRLPIILRARFIKPSQHLQTD